MKYYFLTAAFLIFGANLNAQLNYPPSFVPHGPGGGGYMYSPSINPANPSQIYLTCDMGGVYRSNSNGEAWQLLPQIVSTVKGKVQFTSDPNIQYMVRRSTTNLNDPLQRGEIAKTTDGGSTWSPVNDPTATGVHRLEADPNSTQRILVSEYNQLFFTNDGGASWSVAYHPSDDQLWMGGVFWDGNQIYVGTNKGLLVSHNGGQTFSIETHAGMPAEEGIFHLSGAKQGGVTRLFVVTALQQEMYAWLEVLDLRQYIQQVYRMDYQQGATWQNTRGNIENGVFLNWIDLAQNDVEKIWAAGDVNGLPLIFLSLDGGQTWSNLFFASDNENVLTGWGGDYGAFSYLWSGAALGFDVNDSNPDHVVFTDGMGHITNSSGSEWRAIDVTPAS
ncbi:MAG: hypothetical protein JNJ57_12560 [Saprospiraceae bacterium]|nr:hypothetical protein [Saprospiraceae bacterium]